MLNNTLGEKLAVFIEFKNEILRPYGLRMTRKKLINKEAVPKIHTVILSEAKNLIFLMNFSPDVFKL
jgi:hypothetical protein